MQALTGHGRITGRAKRRNGQREDQAIRPETREIQLGRFILLSCCFSARIVPCGADSFDATFPDPFAGSRMLRDFPRMEGHPGGRMKVRTLMKKMGVEAIDRKPDLSKRHFVHLIYPWYQGAE